MNCPRQHRPSPASPTSATQAPPPDAASTSLLGHPASISGHPARVRVLPCGGCNVRYAFGAKAHLPEGVGSIRSSEYERLSEEEYSRWLVSIKEESQL